MRNRKLEEEIAKTTDPGVRERLQNVLGERQERSSNRKATLNGIAQEVASMIPNFFPWGPIVIGSAVVASLIIAFVTVGSVEPPTNIDAFFECVRYHDLAKVKAGLAKYPAWANAMDEEGNSPLFLAACNNDTEMVKVLVGNGANTNFTKNVWIENLYDLGGRWEWQTPLGVTRDPEIKRILREQRSDRQDNGAGG